MLTTRWITGLLTAALLGSAVACAGPIEDETDVLEKTGKAFAAIARKAIPAVVFIQVEKAVPVAQMGSPHGPFNDPRDFFGEEFFERFFGQPMPRGRQPQPRHRKQMGQGSGFLISKNGDILTNSHVVGDADKITVRLHDGREFEAERVGSDPKSEVAVIRINTEDELPFLDAGDSDELEIGEWVVAVGNPFGLAETVTAGIVSGKGRSNIGIADYENFIQTDAAINPGNSGGPLLNIKGDVVGINTAIYSRSGGYMGIGFAIPVNMAVRIKDQLLKTGKVSRGYLGVYIQDVTPDLAASFDLEEGKGILVSDVTDDSAAQDAGLRAGDIILGLDGQPVKAVGSFRNNVASRLPGTTFELTIFRDGQEMTVKAKTRALPGEAAEEMAAEIDEEKFGITVKNLTRELAERFGFEVDEGVIVSEVASDSVAANAGLQPGLLITEVNRVSITNVKEFREQASKALQSGRVLLRIKRKEGSRYFVLRLN